MAKRETDTATLPANTIECEVCGSQYERRLGSVNDCPTCNAPGGKGPDSAISAENLKGMSSAVAGAFERVTQNVNLMSARVANLEQEVSNLKAKLQQ